MLSDTGLRVGDVVEHVDSPLRAQTTHPVDDSTLVPWLHALPATVPESPNILLRGDGVAMLEPLRDLLIRTSVNLGGGDMSKASRQLLLDLHGRGSRSRSNVNGRGSHVAFWEIDWGISGKGDEGAS